MAPKKKKQPKNAYYFFMMDFKDDKEQQGIRFPGGMKEVAEAATEAWKALTYEERIIYEDKAAASKLKDKSNLENKFTTTGISYAQLEREDKERRRKELKMQLEIEGTIQGLNRETTLKHHSFFLIHFNFFCRYEDGKYLVCEVGIVEFNLALGVKARYHNIIRQENIRLGYSFEADKTSLETHKIPVPPMEIGIPFSADLFLEIKEFLEQGKTSGNLLPPVYTLPNNLEVVESALTELAERFYPQNPDIFRVYPLPKLFYELRNACAPKGSVGFPVMALAERELDKDQYNFSPGISCARHEKTDECVFCSISIVHRWTYLICDHCCKDLSITVIRGSHVPLNSALGIPAQELKRAPPQVPRTKAAGRSKAPDSKPISLIDHSKLGPPEDEVHHYNVSTAGTGAALIKKPAGQTGQAWGTKQDAPAMEPLRLPRTTSTAAAMDASAKFTEADFPAIGNRVRVPAAVAGRGRGRVLESEPLVEDSRPGSAVAAGVGRGRGRGILPGQKIAANFPPLK